MNNGQGTVYGKENLVKGQFAMNHAVGKVAGQGFEDQARFVGRH